MPSGIDTRGMPHGIHTVDSDFSESRLLMDCWYSVVGCV